MQSPSVVVRSSEYTPAQIRELRKMRSYVHSCGYIGPIAKDMAEALGINIGEVLELLKGTAPVIDDFDNGRLDVLLDINLTNDGKPTYELRNCKRAYGVHQRDFLTRSHHLASIWPNITRLNKKTDRRDVCDAWHPANPRARDNFIRWILGIPGHEINGRFKVDLKPKGRMHSPITSTCRQVQIKPKATKTKVDLKQPWSTKLTKLRKPNGAVHAAKRKIPKGRRR